MLDKKIIEKVEKVLQTAESYRKVGDIHAAERAEATAHDLMSKYAIVRAQLNLHDKEQHSINQEYIPVHTIKQKTDGKIVESLWGCVAKHNMCTLINVPKGDFKKDLLWLIGTPENIELVKFWATKLMERVKEEERRAWLVYTQNPGNEKRNAFKRGFYAGAIRQVIHNIKEAWDKTMKEVGEMGTGLVIGTCRDIEDFLGKELAKQGQALKKSKQVGYKGMNGAASGEQAGKRIRPQHDLKTHFNNKALN